jgi:hypothetical protein
VAARIKDDYDMPAAHELVERVDFQLWGASKILADKLRELLERIDEMGKLTAYQGILEQHLRPLHDVAVAMFYDVRELSTLVTRAGKESAKYKRNAARQAKKKGEKNSTNKDKI